MPLNDLRIVIPRNTVERVPNQFLAVVPVDTAFVSEVEVELNDYGVWGWLLATAARQQSDEFLLRRCFRLREASAAACSSGAFPRDRLTGDLQVEYEDPGGMLRHKSNSHSGHFPN
jgi:hypothetical protein